MPTNLKSKKDRFFTKSCITKSKARAFVRNVCYGPFHDNLLMVVSNKWFDYAVLAMVVLHTSVRILQNSLDIVTIKSAWYLSSLGDTILVFFVMEWMMKLYAYRLKFLKNPLNIYEAVLWMNVLCFYTGVYSSHSFLLDIGTLIEVFLTLRILRLLWILHHLEKLQVMFRAVLKSLPALGSIIILITLFLYIFTVIGHGVYSQVDTVRYGNLAKASLTLFQLLTLDDWFEMYTDVINTSTGYQHIIVYLVLFIVLETFVLVNLFVAVIVDNLARVQEKSKRTPTKDKDDHQDLQANNTEPVVSNIEKSLINAPAVFPTIDNYYSQLSHKSLHKHYWQLLACLEHNFHVTQNHQLVLNELVDLVDFTKN